MGGGDIKLTAMLGAALGWQPASGILSQPVLIALSQLVGGLIALALLISRRAGRKIGPARGSPLIALLGGLLLSAAARAYLTFVTG